LRAAARRTVLERYDLATACLPEQVKLIETLARKGRPRATGRSGGRLTAGPSARARQA
jgi:hypothetical protein